MMVSESSQSSRSNLNAALLLVFFVVVATIALNYDKNRLPNFHLRPSATEVLPQESDLSAKPSRSVDYPDLSDLISDTEDDSSFVLTSSGVTDGILDEKYTCYNKHYKDGDQLSPPLKWKGAPDGTVQYMVIMWSHHEGYDCDRYEWVLYDIDGDVDSLKKSNKKDVGTLGGTFPGEPKYEYATPCPSGDGYKTYVFTVYALSDDLASYVKNLDDDYYKTIGPELVLLATNQNMVLATASLEAKYCNSGCEDADGAGIVTNADDDGQCI
jgi:phosphatidylethanolamine-binding protein (PEBP) family uncharacterized protein